MHMNSVHKRICHSNSVSCGNCRVTPESRHGSLPRELRVIPPESKKTFGIGK